VQSLSSNHTVLGVVCQSVVQVHGQCQIFFDEDTLAAKY
jgi:hypothetical protein